MYPAHTLDVNGATLALYSTGQGPLLLLVHGYPLDHRMWLDLLQGPPSAGRRLCAVDLRGHGASPWAGDAVHTMEALADDLAQVVQALAPDGRVDLVGLSMGGYVALAFAERHRERLRSLALVDTRAGDDGPAVRQGRQRAMADTLEHGRHWLAQALLPRLVAPGASPLVRARLQSMVESTPVETILADLAGMMQRPDRQPLLPTLSCPVLVVVGEHDALTPPDEARAMAAAVPGARLVVLPGAGHMAPMEAPAAFRQALLAWLDETSPAAAAPRTAPA